eukprot:11187037-Lingulodinium_polyedra.AAC.1
MYQPTVLERPAAGEPVPCLGGLGDDRITVQVFRNGDTIVLKDQWRSGSAQRLPLSRLDWDDYVRPPPGRVGHGR